MSTFADYATIDAVNWSTLKEMLRSPKHYLHATQNKRPDTAALAAGRFVHAAVFEPDTLDRDFAVYAGDGTRASKEYKAFAAEHAGKTILKADEADPLLACAQSVLLDPQVRPYLDPEDGAFEVPQIGRAHV